MSRFGTLLAPLFVSNPNFLWVPEEGHLYEDRIGGFVGTPTSGVVVKPGGVANPTPNGNGGIIFPTDVGLGANGTFVALMVVTIEDPTAVTGCFLKIGGTSDGVGIGGGNTTFENSGGKIIQLREGIAWAVSSSAAFVRGLNIVAAYMTNQSAFGAVDKNTGVFVAGAAATYSDPTASLGINGYTTSRGSNAVVHAVSVWKQSLTNAEYESLILPIQLSLAPIYGAPRSEVLRMFAEPRLWALGALGAGAGGGTAVTSSASGRLRARGADAVTTFRTTASTGRLRARGGTSAQPIKVAASTGRIKARGSDVTTSIRTTLASGRLRARGTTAASQVAPGVVVTSATGRLRARGGCAATSIRTVAVTGRIKARGAATATSIRTGLASGRLKARGVTTAAPVVAGTIVTSGVGRLRARGSNSCTTTRVVAETGRLRARGTVSVATIRPTVASGRLRARSAGSAGPYVAPVTLSIDRRYLVPARGRQFTAKARGRRFTART